MAKSTFDQIKKQNGERFAKAIRAYDNGIFDIPNIVERLKYAGSEAEPIMLYLVSLKNIKIEEHAVHKDPITLLSEAGYDAYYADTLEKQNAIQKYYTPKEELCTFRDPTRFVKYFIINAIKKDVANIKREDFKGKEKREDQYGTSVLSIQILKNGGFISIKNRYNHTIVNPDNTFNSNPDNIISGLSDAIKHHFHVDFSTKETPLPDNFIVLNDKIIHYNFERDDIYFGDNFYVKNGTIHPIDRDKELLLDSFLFNTKTKEIKNISSSHTDSLPDILMNEIKNKKIQITKAPLKPDGKSAYWVKADNIPIILVQDGRITELNLPNTTQIKDNFGLCCHKITKLTAPILKKMGNHVLTNSNIKELNIPQIQHIGSHSLAHIYAKNVELLNLESIGDLSMAIFAGQSLYMPCLKNAGNQFLCMALSLKNLDAPLLTTLKDESLQYTDLETLDCPKLQTLGNQCLYNCEKLTTLNAPSLKEVGNECFFQSPKLQTLNCPNLEKVGTYFLHSNSALKNLSLPALKQAEACFLRTNYLSTLDCPQLEVIGNDSLSNSKNLYSINCPKLKEVGQNFLRECGKEEESYLMIGDTPKSPTKEIHKLKHLSLPNLHKVGKGFLEYNVELETLNAPLLKKADISCLKSNNHYKTNAPALKANLPTNRHLTLTNILESAQSNQPHPNPTKEITNTQKTKGCVQHIQKNSKREYRA